MVKFAVSISICSSSSWWSSIDSEASSGLWKQKHWSFFSPRSTTLKGGGHWQHLGPHRVPWTGWVKTGARISGMTSDIKSEVSVLWARSGFMTAAPDPSFSSSLIWTHSSLWSLIYPGQHLITVSTCSLVSTVSLGTKWVSCRVQRKPSERSRQSSWTVSVTLTILVTFSMVLTTRSSSHLWPWPLFTIGEVQALAAINNNNNNKVILFIYQPLEFRYIRTLASDVLVENDSWEQWAAPLITWGL